MADGLVSFEQFLLVLGKRELQLERQLQELKAAARDAAQNNRFDGADQMWVLYEKSREQLSSLQQDIARLEVHLYVTRRCSRRRVQSQPAEPSRPISH